MRDDLLNSLRMFVAQHYLLFPFFLAGQIFPAESKSRYAQLGDADEFLINPTFSTYITGESYVLQDLDWSTNFCEFCKGWQILATSLS